MHNHNHKYNQHLHTYQVVLQQLRRHGLVRITTLGLVLLFLITGLYHIFGSESEEYSPYHRFPTQSNLPTYETPTRDWNGTAAQVRQAFIHAYHGYERYASPHDELKPKSKTSADPFTGWAVSVFDSLDTMLIMGLDAEFERALPIVMSTNFDLREAESAPYFETVIRYLGGLLSAYAISHKPILLQRAEELAEKLDPIFDHWPSGFPSYGVNPTTGKVIGPETGILAEIASFQVEYTYLAKVTNKRRYLDRVNKVVDTLFAANLTATRGMAPLEWDLSTGQPHSVRKYHLSVGGQADSMHEYLLKNWLMAGKTDRKSLQMYIRATTQILTTMLYVSPNRELLYVTDTMVRPGHDDVPSHAFEHLSCFLPGLLALGAHTVPLDAVRLDPTQYNNIFASPDPEFAAAHSRLASFGSLKELHLWAAEGLAQTCYLMYADQPTGLGAEEVLMMDKGNQKGGKNRDAVLWIDALERWRDRGVKGEKPPGVADKPAVVYSEAHRVKGRFVGRDYVLRKTEYLLRPETVESLYVMWKVTGDVKWRQRGWEIFRAIERETKTAAGYAIVRSVERSPAELQDAMPSFFLAETLKYLYLLFLEGKDPFPLDQWVYNTEAHPFPVFEWTDADRVHFGLPPQHA